MRTLTTLGVVVFLAASAALAQQPGSLTVQHGYDAVEGAKVFVQTNDGAQSLGTTNSTGALAGIDPSWFTAKPQGDVIVRECSQGTEIYLNTSDGTAEEACKKIGDENGNGQSCTCRRAGVFVWSQNMILQIGSAFPWPWVAGGAGGGALVIAALAGGDENSESVTSSTSGSTSTSGDPSSSSGFTCQYNVQFQFTGGSMELYMEVGPLATMIEVVVSGSNITVRGLGNHSFVTLTGNHASSSGAFTATGIGSFGDFQNVPFTFTGPATADGPISGTLKAGPGGNLPGDIFVQWQVNGQKK